MLVVEDTPAHADLVRVMLAHTSGPSWAVAVVDTLEEATAWLEGRQADVVLLDLNLPDSHGPVTAGRLCSRWPELPVVICTSSTEETVAIEGLRLGAQDHLVKGEFEGALLSRTLRLAMERKRAERGERFQPLFEANPQPMWVLDLQTTRFLEVNEAAVRHYGYSREEFLAMHLGDIRPPEDGSPPEAPPGRLRTAAPADGTWRHRTKDGRLIDVEVSGHDLDFAGRRGRLVVAHDVTERNQLQAQLLQAQKMEAVGRLAGGIAHDFNNLLGVITGYMGLLRRDLEDERNRKRVDEVVKAADRAASLTRHLLAFSRKQALQPRVLDLNQLVAEMEDMLRRLIGEDVQMVTLYGEGVGQMKADAGQVEQVILNLAVNARDAMPGGGRLLIETSSADVGGAEATGRLEMEPGRYVVLAVSDTGLGMSPEVCARIFEPFFTTKGPERGTGLGLSTVYGIVRQSGGQIFVDSERGHGTTFRLYFPRTEAAPEAVRQVEESPAAGGTETILLVEDDDALRSIIQTMLEESGYTVLPAALPSQALELSRTTDREIHLLLTDMVMPEQGGRELAELVLQVRPQTRVIYMSGYIDAKVGGEGALGPDDHFVEKPFTQERLLRELRAVLDA